MAARLHDRFVRWALRVKPPEPAPIVLAQRRVYVLPTRPGLVHGLSVGAMLLAAINYNLSLGYALAFLLGGLVVPTMLHTFRNLAYLRLMPGRADPVFAGETAHFGLVLSEDRGRERRRIGLRLAGQASAETVDIPPNGSSLARLECPAPRRGWLAMPRVTLETTYPLGLIRAWSYAAPDARCLVYPAPAEGAPPPPFQGGAPEGSGQDGGREDFAGLRKHQPADSPRHVAWKQAARRSEAPLLAKQFAGAGAAILRLDWEALPTGLGTEEKLSLLARQVLDAHAAGLAWGLRLPGRDLAVADGETHRHACLEALALHGIE